MDSKASFLKRSGCFSKT